MLLSIGDFLLPKYSDHINSWPGGRPLSVPPSAVGVCVCETRAQTHVRTQTHALPCRALSARALGDREVS